MKKKKNDKTLILNSEKVEKENKSTENSDVDTLRGKDNKKMKKKKKEQTLSLNSEKGGKEDTNVYIDIPKEKDNTKMKKKKKETVTFNSAKVEKGIKTFIFFFNFFLG
jgi:hypothetical protein